jgi:hypothetical protein
MCSEHTGGAKSEGWNAETSTLSQVFISIQSEILVPNPYFNEPGYDRLEGTPEGRRGRLVLFCFGGLQSPSEHYNNERRVQTIRYAMIQHLRSPPAGFEDVVWLLILLFLTSKVIEHFKMLGARIVEQCERYDFLRRPQ